jgi:hypothetical protein
MFAHQDYWLSCEVLKVCASWIVPLIKLAAFALYFLEKPLADVGS